MIPDWQCLLPLPAIGLPIADRSDTAGRACQGHYR